MSSPLPWQEVFLSRIMVCVHREGPSLTNMCHAGPFRHPAGASPPIRPPAPELNCTSVLLTSTVLSQQGPKSGLTPRLLEEAAQESDEWAFLAATLLDTLLQHFEIGMPASTHPVQAPGSSQPRRVISLANTCVPPSTRKPSHSLPEVISKVAQGQPWTPAEWANLDQPCTLAGVQMPFTPADFLVFLAGAPPLLAVSQVRVNQDVVHLLDAGPFSRQHTHVDRSTDPRRIMCYTDGSFYPPKQEKPAAAGWACVFLEPRARTLSCAYGSLPPWLTEKVEVSAYQAECTALLFAGMIAADAFKGVPVQFLSDCQAALGIASGSHKCATGGCPQALRHIGAEAVGLC